MDDSRYLELIASYLSGNISDEEKEVLFSWVNENEANKTEFEEMQELWELTTPKETIFEADKSIAWSNIEKQIASQDTSTTKIVHPSFVKQLLRIAAIFLLLAGSTYWWINNNNTNRHLTEVRTGAKEEKELTLPDGSKIWMNENSTLMYAAEFEKREIIFAGEAFFDVAHLKEKPFVIKSGEAQVTVLGTAFNVRAYPKEDIIEVTVERGKVAFSIPGGTTSAQILTPEEYGVLDKEEGLITKAKIVSPNATAWKTERLVFKDTPIFEVKKSLERYYGISLAVSNSVILNCPFSITTDNAKNKLGEILGSIEFSLGIEIQKRDSTYLLIGSGCE